eukprot:TRINITY_DN17242_c0_g1_i1.p1 TRINITY_DN17242_c0_g1~~TRINITY_DN17242_c0_g1_i1.p1  ORF type:complete len:691 (+),score=89.92 TRINITY_DN17242_c0_g1_i1:667-2739(+)
MFVECSLGPGYTVLDTVLDSMASSAAAEDARDGQVKVPTENQRARWTESPIRWAVLAQEGWTDEDEKQLQRLSQSVAKWRKYMGAPEGVEVKGWWSPEEDNLLSRLVKKFGARNWHFISPVMAGRSAKSCRLRWCNQLNPDVEKRPFTPEEDEVILQAHAVHGNKWATIAKLLPGRTDNAVKNHFNSMLRRTKTEERRTQRLLDGRSTGPDGRSVSPRGSRRSAASEHSGHLYSATTQDLSEGPPPRGNCHLIDLNELPAVDNYESGPESSNVGGVRDCSDRRGREGSVQKTAKNCGVNFVFTTELRTGVSVEGRAESSEVEQAALAASRLEERSAGKRNRRRGGEESGDKRGRSIGEGRPDLREESAECEGERALKIARVGFPETAGELVSDGSPRFSSISLGGEDTAPQRPRSGSRQGLSPRRIGQVAQGQAQERGSDPESQNFLQLGRGPAFGTLGRSPSLPTAANFGGGAAVGAGWPQMLSAPSPLPVTPGRGAPLDREGMPDAPPHRGSGAFPTDSQPLPQVSHPYPAAAVSRLGTQVGDFGYGPPVPVLGTINPAITAAARSETGQLHSSLLETGRVNSLLMGWASQLQETGQHKQVTDRLVAEMNELFGRLAQGGGAFQQPWCPPRQHPMWLMTPAAQQQYLASLFQPGAAAFSQQSLVNPAFLSPNPLAYQVPAMWSPREDS